MKTKPKKPTPMLRPILAGEKYSRAVEGGVARTHAAMDGLVVSTADMDLFFPLSDVELAIADLAVRKTAAQ